MFLPFSGFILYYGTTTLMNNVQIWSPSDSRAQCAYHRPWVQFWNGLDRLLLKMRILCSTCETLFTTCCLALVVVHGMPTSNSAIWTCAIALWGWTLLLTKYSAWSDCRSLVRKGITLCILGLDWGVLGIPKVDQKSSANLPVQYPCLVIGVDFVCMTLLLPLFVMSLVGKDPSKMVLER